MAVVGVLVEAVVGHQHERVADLVAQVAQRDLHDAVGGVGAASRARPSWPGRRTAITAGTPRSASARTSLRRLSCVCCTTPGIDTIGSGASMPSFTNSGATRSSTREPGLGDQPPQRGRAAQPAQAPLGERHAQVPGYRSARDAHGDERRAGGDEAVDRVRIGLGVDAQAALRARSRT